MTKKAIIYLRWSTLEQGNSDRSSEDRQDANTKRAAELNGWDVAERIVDSGRSAFTGANLEKGNLGSLTRRFHSGILDPSNHVLIVEEMDRLSRQSPGTMTAWLTPLLSLGLTIHIANTGQTITSQVMERDFGGFVTLMSSAFSSHDFSRKQSERGASSWTKRRAAAAQDGKVLSRHRGRGWLEWDDLTKRYKPIHDRVWLIEEMFRMRLAGHGKLTIAKRFNEAAENEDQRYKAWSSSRTQPENWTTSAIARIVQDRAVTGYLQYHRNPRGAEMKVAVGDPVKVYPEVIDPETFARANDQRLDNQLKSQGRGRAISNLLGPIARCGECGGTMQPLGSSRHKIKKDGTKVQHYFLYCQTAKMTKSTGCSNQRGWTYSKIEQALLNHLLTLAIDDQHFRADDEIASRLEGDVVRLQRNVMDLKASKKRILSIIARIDDAEAQEEYELADARLRECQTDLETAQSELSAAKGTVTPSEHLVRVSEVRSRMDSDDEDERYEARALVKAAFQGLIQSIAFDGKRGIATVKLVQGMAAMHITHDGRSGFLNLVKKGREYVGVNDSENTVVDGFMRRLGKKV